MNDDSTTDGPQGSSTPDPLDDTQRVDVPRYAPTPDPRPDARWAWAAPGSQPQGDRWQQPAQTEPPAAAAPDARPPWSSTGTPPPAYNAAVQAPTSATASRRRGSAGV